MSKNQISQSLVSLVGAGPGDPKLLTLRGKEALEQADYVVYDYLVSPSLLKFATSSEHIYVGKKGGDLNSASQKSIDQLLLSLAKKGKRIVRLKGGDPFIFGRGGEEALILAKHKIPFEIIPGITSGIAAPAYAGIPVTHRTLAAEVTFITGHEDPTKEKQDINWKAVAGLSGTIVLFMGIKTLPQIIKTLIGYGKSPKTQVSVIRWGTTANQKVVTGQLSNIAEKIKKAKLTPPALTVIGEVNNLRKDLKWFEEKPLFGKTVLVTRSRKQASQLSEQLEDKGARVIEVPTIEIEMIDESPKLNSAMNQIKTFNWIVLTSENGVDAFFNHLKRLKKDTRILGQVKIAAIGPGTRAKLNSFLIEPHLMPREFSTDGLLGKFKKMNLLNQKFLLLRANIAPDLLNKSLVDLGADVTEIPIYKTVKPEGLSKTLTQTLHEETVDFLTFTSSSTAQNFFESLKNGKKINAKIISIGPVTSKTIRDQGFKVNREAKESTIPGLVKAVLAEVKK